jgi:hypothetical protein
MAAIYGCSLDVPAWTSEAAREGHRGYRPRLAILRTGPGEAPELVAKVTIFLDANPARDRRAARLFPAEIRGLSPGIDEGHQRYRASVDTLALGEVRVPRETPQEALRIAIERLVDVVPRADLAAVEKVAGLLLGALQQSGTAYARQFRPAR